MTDGWIKLYRKSFDHWLYNESRPHTRREAWEDILLMCNHDDTKILIHGELIVCKRGQSVMSLKSWATHFKWTIQKVRTFFELLRLDSMIELEGLKKTTRITVCNYDVYQTSQHTDNTQITFEQHTDNTQITTNKNEKNEKNINTSSLRSEVSSTEVTVDVINPPESDKIPFAKIVEYWNENTKLPKVSKLTEARKKIIRARWNDFGGDGIKTVMKKTFDSGFLNGENTNRWSADFDWVFNQSNFIKIIEGNYDNEKRGHQNGRKLSTAEQNYKRNTESVIQRLAGEQEKFSSQNA
jgi:hypothetical protein